MIWLSLAVGLPMVVMMSWAVGVAIKTDEQIGQARQIAGKRVVINREGCAEAASLCAYEAVAGGVGGGDCKEFYRLTGETVWDYCCRTDNEGCKIKPPPDGREGVGGR